MGKRISESELVLPSLFLMSNNRGSITTAALQVELRNLMQPDGEDIEILKGRGDDKFSQKVRNLKSHDTFEKLGYAKSLEGFGKKTGHFEITREGNKYLEDNKDILRYLLFNNFTYTDLKDSLNQVSSSRGELKIKVFDENTLIQEGEKRIACAAIYQRSAKLKERAMEHYKVDGKIFCDCCNFNFEDLYGSLYGANYIEIHHIKPIFMYDEGDLNDTINNAIKNVIPVCSNCHRMIHRKRAQPLDVLLLKETVSNNRALIL